MTFLIIALICAILFVLSLHLSLPLQVRLAYIRKGNDDNLHIEMKILYGLFRYEYNIPYANLMLSPSGRSLTVKNEFESRNMEKEETDYLDEDSISPARIQQFFEKISELKENYSLGLLLFLSILRGERDPRAADLISAKNPLFMGTLFGMLWNIKGKCNRFRLNVEFGASNPAVTGMAVGFLWWGVSLIMPFLRKNITFKHKVPEISIKPIFNKKVIDVNFDGIFKLKNGQIINATIESLIIQLKKKGGNLIGKSSDRRINEDSNGEHQKHGGRQHDRGKSSGNTRRQRYYSGIESNVWVRSRRDRLRGYRATGKKSGKRQRS